MDTRAVYKIHEKGREFYFYTRYAGGFSYPFEAAKYLNTLKHALEKNKGAGGLYCAAAGTDERHLLFS